MAQIDKILSVYKELSEIPILKSAKIIPTEGKVFRIQSLWSQGNLERSKRVKIHQEFVLNSYLQPILECSPIDVSSEVLKTTSIDGKFSVVLRDVEIDGKAKQFIEFWDCQKQLKTYDLSVHDVHGKVYFDPTFSTFQLSADNSKLLYVAEKKLPKSEPYYKTKSPSKSSDSENDEKTTRGTEYVFKPDWGEQLVGKHQSVLVVLNLVTDSIEIMESLPEKYFPGEAIWAPEGTGIVGIAYKRNFRYLGAIFCTNRESYVFHLKDSEFKLLTKEKLHCASPRFSPDGKRLVWMERATDFPHHNAHRLMSLDWNTGYDAVESATPETLIPVVETSMVIHGDKQFFGLFNHGLPKRCFSSDSKHLFFSTPQESHVKSYSVDLQDGKIVEFESTDGCSLTILDVVRDTIALLKTSLVEPSQLVTGRFDALKPDDTINLIECSKSFKTSSLKILGYDVTHCLSASSDSGFHINYLYLGKKGAAVDSMPLIVVPHGGPHVSSSNEFSATYACFALLGFGVVLVNYLGSTGMGTKRLEAILGRIGESDISDCLTAITSALEKYPSLNSKNLTLFGGSHGGFMLAHLSGQYHDKFRAVVMRNPAIEIATMFNISDIPDCRRSALSKEDRIKYEWWFRCTGETGSGDLGVLPENTQPENYVELIQKMYGRSPIIHVDKVKAPTLIALGSEDLRVPASQGKMWYYRLKENGVKVKILMYDDNHSLAKDEVQIDFIINAALWLIEHTDYEALQGSLNEGNN